MTEHHVYPSSLARFATGLGPEAWQIILKKLNQSLPPNVEFEPLQFAYEMDANLRPVIPTARNNAPS